MAEVRWIKIVTDIFDDDKILLIENLPDGDSIVVCWFKLLCLAGKQNNSGVLMLNDRIAYTDEMLATVFRRPLQTVRLALDTFERFGMIEIINGAITIPNWGKHQSLDRLEKLREYQKEYHREYRKKQAQIPEACQPERKLYVNASDIEEEKDKKKNQKKVFVPPTLDEVRAYVKERKSPVNPDDFWEYYSTGEWKDSKGNPVRNWKQKLLTWERKDEQKPKRQYTTAAEYKPPNSKIDVEKLQQLKEMVGSEK